MIISAQVLLAIGSVITILPSALSTPRARKKHVPCPPFPYATLENGKITVIGTQKYMFTCDPGYFLTSPPQVRCWKGKWSSAKHPKCNKSEGQCEDPPPIPGGEILGKARHIGSTIQYLCNAGFVLVGDGSRVCLQSGHWSGVTPACMDESEPIQKVAERLKDTFITEIGNYSSDIPWNNGKNDTPSCTPEASESPCKLPPIANAPTIRGDLEPKDVLETDDETDFTPIIINFPPTDLHFIRKHKRRHKKKRAKLSFKPSLSTIVEEVREESEDEGNSINEMFKNKCDENSSMKSVEEQGRSENSFEISKYDIEQQNVEISQGKNLTESDEVVPNSGVPGKPRCKKRIRGHKTRRITDKAQFYNEKIIRGRVTSRKFNQRKNVQRQIPTPRRLFANTVLKGEQH